jgi:zinc transporter 9
LSASSKRAIYTAITANSAVMVAKFAAFFVSGSGTMLAEGIHSAADVANQSLLALGMKRSARPADKQHPEGYGQEAFVWSLISAVGIFFLGCGFTVMHGIQSLTSGHHEDLSAPNIIIGVLIFSLVVEGGSLAVCVIGLRSEAKKRGLSFREHLRTTSDPFGVAVLLEDFAAVFGVILALITVAISLATHRPEWDAIGSILIGLLLGLVAIFLIRKNSSMLIGQAISDIDREKITAIITEDPLVESLHRARLVVTGTDSLRISAEIDIDGAHIVSIILQSEDIAKVHAQLDSPKKLESWLLAFGETIATQIGVEIDRVESALREAVPNATSVDLEVD